MRKISWCGLVLAAACFSFVATAQAADEKKKSEKKPPSECAGLDTAACATKAQCSWYKEITMKNGKKRRAHCHKKPTRSTAVKKPT